MQSCRIKSRQGNNLNINIEETKKLAQQIADSNNVVLNSLKAFGNSNVTLNGFDVQKTFGGTVNMLKTITGNTRILFNYYYTKLK